MGQNESDDIFVSGVKVKRLMIIGSSILLFIFQWKNKNVDLFTMGSLIVNFPFILIGSLITDEKVLPNDKHTGNYVTWLICSKKSEIKIFL